MKISIDVECTPAEARDFFGLPDVAVLQRALAEELQKRMGEALGGMDAEKLLKTWFPVGFEGLSELQRQFWAKLAEGARKGAGE